MDIIDLNKIYVRAFKRVLLYRNKYSYVKKDLFLVRKLIAEEIWYEYGLPTVKIAECMGMNRKTIMTDRDFDDSKEWHKYLLRYGTTDFKTRYRAERKEIENGN